MTDWRVSLLALGLALAGGAASAQVPGPANPNRVEDRFRPQLAPQSLPGINIPAANAAPPPEEAAKVHFTLKGVVVEGSSVFRPSDFAVLYDHLLGKDVSLLDIYALRDAITAKYRSNGYVLSQAIIPPQQIPGGIVRIQVVEGYIGAVKFEGDVRDRRGLIRAMAEKIKRSRPLRLADLERYVLLIGDLPGVDVSTVLKPSPDEPGASDLIILIKRKLLAGHAEADNRGSLAIGPEQFSAELDANSLLGLDEQTAIGAATTGRTRELAYFYARHDEVLNSEGLKLSLSASQSRSKPGGAIAPLDAVGRNQTFVVALSEPVIRSRSHTLTLGASFTALDSKTNLLGVLDADDRVRFLSLDAALDYADTVFGDAHPATSLARVEFDQGFNTLGATEAGSANLSRVAGRSDFTKLNLDATRVQTLAPRLSLVLAVTGQMTSDPLLSSQQFGLGGARFGRGYEPSELTGDSGAAGSAELRYSPPAWPRLSPQLYAFYETGIVWLNAPLAGEHNGESLASAGVGFRFSIGRYLSAEFELAKPLTRDIASRGNKDVRPLFSVSTNF
jgi:hemolysin activation/secretion protein